MLTRTYIVHFTEAQLQQVIVDRTDRQGWDVKVEKVRVAVHRIVTAADACAAVQAVLEEEARRSTIEGTECKVQVQKTGEWVVVVRDNAGCRLRES